MKNNGRERETDFPYADIVDLPPHISKKHPQASVNDRAARFSPFAAITGYEEMVLEEARVTEQKAVLTEDGKSLINEKLRLVAACVSENPEVAVTYFVPDKKKPGGAYVLHCGRVVSVDSNGGCLMFSEGEKVPFEDILELNVL